MQLKLSNLKYLCRAFHDHILSLHKYKGNVLRTLNDIFSNSKPYLT